MLKNIIINVLKQKNNVKKEIKKKKIINTKYKFSLNNSFTTKHHWHLVDPSPWPLMGAIGAFCLTSGTVLYMHKYNGGSELLKIGFFTIFFTMYVWWRDVVREATFEDQHTIAVQRGLRLGMILFIVSEVMFFFAFFWAFFHSSLAPAITIGNVWPPEAITTIKTSSIPLTNTIYLLSSGAAVTWAHHSLKIRAKRHTIIGLLCTIILATFFTLLQSFEYVNAPFTITDSIFGSCFYITTGFHGLHVLIGTCFLIVVLIRVILNHFTNTHHVGFECGIWYWHFVDVVWLLLFFFVYWWGC